MEKSHIGDIAIDRPFIKGLLMKHRVFLKACFNAKTTKQVIRLIQACSLYQAQILLRIFSLELNNEIILRGKEVKKLYSKKKFNSFVKCFGDNGDFETIMLYNLESKKQLLLKFAPVIPILMEPLFTL
jgi:hypothetical protein